MFHIYLRLLALSKRKGDHIEKYWFISLLVLQLNTVYFIKDLAVISTVVLHLKDVKALVLLF